MSARVLRHMRAHFVGYVALFVALGGTSLAAVNALPLNSVGSPQIKNRSIQTLDVSRRTLAALRGRRGLRGLQGTRGAKGDKGDKGDAGAQGTVGPTFGRAGDSGAACQLTTTSFAICASTGELSLPVAGRVLLVASAGWIGTGPSGDYGQCTLFADDSPVGGYSSEFGQATATHLNVARGAVSATDITDPLPAGPHTFTLKCSKQQGDITVQPASISAVLLGTG
jgi:hypothetical protein